MTLDVPTPARQASERWVILPAICLFLCLVARNAWLSDDAYITLRTVDNFVHGHGLRWNVAERVQAYTHPLWMFLLSTAYLFTHEAFFTTIVVGIVVSLAAVGCLCLQARSAWHAMVALAMLCSSRAFVDFSTSGLENPLTHLLVALFFMHAARGASLTRQALIGALLACNRSDALLIILPTLSWAFGEVLRRDGFKPAFKAVLVGASPLLLWTAFAVLYYGAPFPNTAYAKLNTGIPQAELAQQGFLYLVTSLGWDPTVWVSIPLGLAVSGVSRDRAQWLLAGGVFLQLAYVVWIGGDFMAGRFLTLPLLGCALAVTRARLAFDQAPHGGAAIASIIALLVLPRGNEGWSDVANDTKVRGVVDERSFYEHTSALSAYQRGRRLPDHGWAHDGRAHRAEKTSIRVSANVGFLGFYAGPEVHIIDRLALTDPLLSRLPTARKLDWRPGHLWRVLPDGYKETALGGDCVMKDRLLCRYWDELRLITRGDLWSLARGVAIVKLSFGAFDHLIDYDEYRLPGLLRKRLDELPVRVSDGEPSDSPVIQPMSESGAEIRLEALSHARRLEISLEGDDDYLIELRAGRTTRGSLFIRAAHTRGMLSRARRIPGAASERGFDTLRVLPLRGQDFRLGHLRLSR